MFAKSSSRDNSDAHFKASLCRMRSRGGNNSASSVVELMRDYAEERSSILSNAPSIAKSEFSEVASNGQLNVHTSFDFIPHAHIMLLKTGIN